MSSYGLNQVFKSLEKKNYYTIKITVTRWSVKFADFSLAYQETHFTLNALITSLVLNPLQSFPFLAIFVPSWIDKQFSFQVVVILHTTISDSKYIA